MNNKLIKLLKQKVNNKGEIVLTPKITKELINFLEPLGDTNRSTVIYKKQISLTANDILLNISQNLLTSQDILDKDLSFNPTTTIMIHDIYLYLHYKSAYTLSAPSLDKYQIIEATSGVEVFKSPATILTATRNTLYKIIQTASNCGDGINYQFVGSFGDGEPVSGTSTIDIIIFYSIINHG